MSHSTHATHPCSSQTLKPLSHSAIALYNEPVGLVTHTISTVQRYLPFWAKTRVTIYAKDIAPDDYNGLNKMLVESGADEVVSLPNLGREGETYLVSRCCHE